MNDSNLSQPKKTGLSGSKSIGCLSHDHTVSWSHGLKVRVCCALQVFLLVGAPVLLSQEIQETNAPPSDPAAAVQETNSQHTLQAILQLEDQIRSNQAAIEQSGKEAKDLAARSAEMLSNGLHNIQNALAAQQEGFAAWRSQEVGLLQSSNRILLIAGGALAAIACLTMCLIAYFQWRMTKACSSMAAVFPLRGLNGGAAISSLPVEHSSQLLTGLAAESNRRLLGTMEQLERRILQLEQLSGAALEPGAATPAAGDNGHPSESAGHKSAPAQPAPASDAARVAALLRQGKTLLKENQWEAAISRFDEVLSLKPDHGEALLKKGTALEKLQKLNEAFECYDRAIATHDSMALAYLHKGGLYNRLERFKEALECYEKALHTHDERHG